jgi:hypothetical protein
VTPFGCASIADVIGRRCRPVLVTAVDPTGSDMKAFPATNPDASRRAFSDMVRDPGYQEALTEAVLRPTTPR